MTEQKMREIASQMIRDWSLNPADIFYFVPDGSRLPTYDMVQWLIELQTRRIVSLEQRIARLERPWWKRWLHR